ncbi:RNA polymerase sigma factor [Paenibacillus sp. LHD-117]|uniref:RNA polymerase sigma factor n=1 Tax=Paenibacillus sp. LHD-117 TaxID=3071412 RepID=UPI0027E04632|nr:RNA polymerase sigma factor [Paenibacillus sp. LHD-117]MDQ6422693.1 RNA polymerase sigma factor [Paenibacillus sp. LHD-117]
MKTHERGAGLNTEDRGLEVDVLQGKLQRYCLSLTGTVQDAEDLVQQTWEKTIVRLEKRGHANPEAFLLRVAKNTWIDECRRRRMLRDRLDRLRQPNERAAVDASDAERAISALYRHLSPIQRTVFMLRDTLGYSAAETADLLGTSEGAAKAALHRARQALTAVRDELIRERDGDDSAGGIGGAAEELARKVREAYIEGRVDDLISLFYSNAAAADGLHVVGRMGQAAMQPAWQNPQSAYSLRMSA